MEGGGEKNSCPPSCNNQSKTKARVIKHVLLQFQVGPYGGATIQLMPSSSDDTPSRCPASRLIRFKTAMLRERKEKGSPCRQTRLPHSLFPFPLQGPLLGSRILILDFAECYCKHHTMVACSLCNYLVHIHGPGSYCRISFYIHTQHGSV